LGAEDNKNQAALFLPPEKKNLSTAKTRLLGDTR
jgi:hypothetical protein